jgi:hypothetical protein
MAEIRDYSVTADDNNASSPNGMAENCAPSTVNNTWREGIARMKRWYEDISGVKVTAGSSNTYTLAASRTVASYAQGDAYLFEANHTNTGAATINVDSLGAKSIVHNDGTALRAGDMTAAGMYLISYEANNDRFILVGGLGSAQNLYINNSSPNVTLENSDNVNTDGGRESTIQIKGKQDGNEITTLATIVTSHDGSSDDQKGKMLISINDGDDGDSPSKVAAKFDSDGNAHFAQSVVTNSIIATASNITVDAQGDDTDIIFKGTDGGADTTFLTIDGSAGGEATFNDGINVSTNLHLGHGNDGTTFNHYFGNCNVRLGQNSSGTDLDMNGQGLFIFDDQGSAGTTFTAIKVYNASGGYPIWQNKLSGTIKSEIESNGDFHSATNAFGGTSDLNLKENIVDSGSQWTDIKNIRVRKFSFKEDNLDAPNMIGVIAQELEAAGMGKLVKTHLETNPDANGNDAPVLDSDGNQKSYKSAKYSIIHMKALKALQEAMARIETLETKVAALEAR